MNLPSLPRTLALVAVTVLLGACIGVPDKVRPDDLRTQVPLAGLSNPDPGAWPASDWWKRYDDPQLDELIHRALADSTSLATASSRVALAQSSARLTAAQVGLRINGNAQVARQRLSENGLFPTRLLGFTWYTQGDIGVQGSYDFDLWGGNRAAVAAAIGQVRAAEAGRSAAALGLQVGITRTYFGWLADRQRLALAEKQVANAARAEQVQQVRLRAGLQTSDGLRQAQAQLAGARQQAAALRGSARIRLAILAALVGVSPDQLPALKPRPLPDANARLPEHAGLDLIARRPDIAARRWQVEAAVRGTDAARARFYPDVSISALAGLSSIDMGKLLRPESRVFALTPAVHLPIFEGGLLRAGFGVSKAQVRQAVAQYNDAVLDAARDVSTAALNLERLREQQVQQSRQLQAIQSLLANADARHRRGITSIEPVLGMRAQSLQQQDAALQLDAEILDADVGLIQALGGGYHMPGAPADAGAHPAPASTSSRTPTP